MKRLVWAVTPKHLEVVANISIICVSIAIGWVIREKFLTKSHANIQNHLSAGVQLDVPPSALSSGGRSLVFVLRETCSLCRESADFHRALVRASEAHGIHAVAVMPHTPEEITAYLARHSIPIRSIVQRDPQLLQVSGVPTLILVDERGVIMKSWHGKLDAATERSVFEYIDQLHPPTNVTAVAK